MTETRFIYNTSYVFSFFQSRQVTSKTDLAAVNFVKVSNTIQFCSRQPCKFLSRMKASSLEAKPKVIVISGPTGVGKTRISIELAKLLNGEIISADSVQVYRKLDVGSNKPSIEERNGIVHHLIDIVEPTYEFSAGEFFQRAREATKSILSRHKVPIVVGGTSMYVRWYIYGLPATPPATNSVAYYVSTTLEELNGNWDLAIELLEQLDPMRATKICRNDWYRLRRALEIYYATGKPLSELPLQGGAPNPKKLLQGIPVTDLDYDFRCFFLVAPRKELNRFIDRRCERMIAQDGLLKEVFELLYKRELSKDSSAGKAIGYRQTIEYLTNHETNALDQFMKYLRDFQNASRQYARRQLQWFRGEELFHWVPVEMFSNDISHVAPIEYIMHWFAATSEEYKESTRQRIDAEVREISLKQGKEMKT
ncbi:tRNA dimethylallyltransferase isoform 1 [Galdieria sulphuraria]|nr:tRNA dimethylallyltransferase isoform 1 [Galdieria sulphuraria]EME31549.1 tRNA dimethylallyltransferase isoform 1 [Galdieria sulphuraria]|eukprot:XP_005708069.1 tRNA dimethylallyltransferase isoform 1 [Galdieria sulphuraria]